MQVLKAHLRVDIFIKIFLRPQIGLETLEARVIHSDKEGPEGVADQEDCEEQEESRHKYGWMHIIIAVRVQVPILSI